MPPKPQMPQISAEHSTHPPRSGGVNNREQLVADLLRGRPLRFVNHLHVDVQCGADLRVTHELRDDLARHALAVRPRGVVRLKVSQVAFGIPT
jgi:hypothetical protein